MHVLNDMIPDPTIPEVQGIGGREALLFQWPRAMLLDSRGQ